MVDTKIRHTRVGWTEGSDPSTPSSGDWKLYFKSNGLFYKDDAGIVTGPLGNDSTSKVYYLNATLSDLTEDLANMRTLTSVKDTAGATSGTANSLGSGETKHFVFSTASGEPGVQTIPKGSMRFYLKAKQNSGTRVMRLRLKLYKQTTGGTQTLLATTNDSDALTASYVTYELIAPSVGPFDLTATDRLILKIYYYGESSGTDASVSVQWGNSTDTERMELIIPTLSTRFLAMASYTNLSPLTASPSYPYVTPLDRDMTFKKFAVAAYVTGTNNGSNYWSFELQYISGGSNVTIATVTTAAASATTWTLISTTTFSPVSLGASGVRLLVTATKVGTPGDVYLSGAIVEAVV